MKNPSPTTSRLACYLWAVAASPAEAFRLFAKERGGFWHRLTNRVWRTSRGVIGAKTGDCYGLYLSLSFLGN